MVKTRTKTKKPIIICLEGIHGVGKTTVFEILKRSRNSSKYKFYDERIAARPLFPFGSKDINIAFRAETHFMQQMIQRNLLIQEDIAKKQLKVALLDRSAISVMVYSKALNLEQKDFKLLDDYLNSVNWEEQILIFLTAAPETIYRRIRMRGTVDPERLEWNEDDIDYIRRLDRYYDYYLSKMKNKLQIFKINTDSIMPDEVAQKVLEIISQFVPRPPPIPGQESIDSWIKKPQ